METDFVHRLFFGTGFQEVKEGSGRKGVEGRRWKKGRKTKKGRKEERGGSAGRKKKQEVKEVFEGRK